MSIKIGMVSLGCPKNQVDAELMLNKLCKDNNYEIVNDENMFIDKTKTIEGKIVVIRRGKKKYYVGLVEE